MSSPSANESPLQLDLSDVDPRVGQLVGGGQLWEPCSATDICRWVQFAREHLASYKVPPRVLFFREDELAMTGNEKVKAGALRELAAARLVGAPGAQRVTSACVRDGSPARGPPRS